MEAEEKEGTLKPKKRVRETGGRKDRSDRLKRRKELSLTCKPIKWKKICNHPLLRQYTPKLLKTINKLMLVVYLFLDYYVTEIYSADFEKDIEWGEELIRHCCLGLLQKSNWKKDQVFQPQFLEILQKFIDRLRLKPKNCKYLDTMKEDLKGLSFFENELSTMIWTMCRNHLVFNLKDRMIDWIQFKLKLPRKFIARAKFFDAFKETGERNEEQKFIFDSLGGALPDETLVKDNFNHFVKVSVWILSEFQSSEDYKGKLFSIFPQKAGFSFAHVHWSNSTLQQFLTWIQRHEAASKEKNYPNFDLPILTEGKLITKEWFDENADILWRHLFKVQLLETKKQKFAQHISTNGYSCSLMLEQPKKSTALIREETSRFKKKPTKVDSRDYRLPEDVDSSTLDRFVAIDPGYTNLFCADIRVRDEEGTFTRIGTQNLSTKQYHHESKMPEQRFYYSNLLKRNPEIEKILQSIPSVKTCIPEEILDAADYIISQADELFDFFAKSALFKFKFKVKIFQAKTLTRHCKKLVGSNSKTCVIGLGDWSRSDGFVSGIFGSPPPNQKLVKELAKQQRTNFLLLDEHCTSKYCCNCHHPLENLRLYCHLSKSQILKNKSLPEEKKKLPGIREVHHVLRCTNNNECGITWNRDVTSSKSQSKILECVVLKRDRPLHLRRGYVHPEIS